MTIFENHKKWSHFFIRCRKLRQYVYNETFLMIFNHCDFTSLLSYLGAYTGAKIYTFKITYFKNFTFLKSHFSQKSHFQNRFLPKKSHFRSPFFTKIAFSKSHMSHKSHLRSHFLAKFTLFQISNSSEFMDKKVWFYPSVGSQTCWDTL